MKKLLVSFCLVIFCLVSFGQVYQEMPQYGYRANRMAFDSTLQIPTVCGVPTLKSVVSLNKAAISFDSCNNKFYKYNPKTKVWSEISGGSSIDTTSLSNRINFKIDSLKRFSDSVYSYKNGVKIFQYKDSIGTTQSLQQVTDIGNTTTNQININKQIFDTMSTYGLGITYDNYTEITQFGKFDNYNGIVYYPIYSIGVYQDYFNVKAYNDSSGIPEINLGSSYGGITITNKKIVQTANTTTNKFNLLFPENNSMSGVDYNLQILNRNVNSNINSDTVATLRDVRTNTSNTIDTTSLSNRINTKVNISDTALMLSKYLKSVDTTNKYVSRLSRGVDSFYYFVGSNRYAIKDSVGNTSGFVPYTGATTDVDLGARKLSAQSLQVEGTNGNGHIDLKHQNSDASATGSSTALFANSSGDLKYKNASTYYTTLKTNQSANRIYSFQNKDYTIGDSADISTKVNISDTATMLFKYMRYADSSVMLSKYLRKSDTTAMLVPYFRKSDTASLSSRIDSKNYAIGLGGTAITINASTTYYFGTPAQTVTNSAAIRRIYIPVSGTLKGGQIYAKTTVATTTENWTLSIRLNNTTNTTFATVGNTTTDKVFGTSSLNIAVVAGDYIEITTTTPAFVTGPGATFFYGTIFIQ